MDCYNITNEAYNRYVNELAELWKGVNFGAKKEKIESFCSLLNPQSKILDLACGTGRDSGYFGRMGFRCIGVDRSSSMLKLARQRHPEMGFFLMDMRYFSFTSNSFDGIWCRGAIPHINGDDLPEVLRQVKQTLRPRGIFYVSVISAVNKGISRIGNTRAKVYFNGVGPESFEAIMQDLKFVIKRKWISEELWASYIYSR